MNHPQRRGPCGIWVQKQKPRRAGRATERQEPVEEIATAEAEKAEEKEEVLVRAWCGR